MLIDGLLAIVMLWALFKGYKNGLIVGCFSFAAVLIGLAAAVKLSAWVARVAEHSMQWHSSWLPFLAFLAVLVAVIILVRIAAKLIETAMQALLVGWLNTVGGIVMYVLLYGTLFSVVLFYFEKLHIIGTNEITASRAYPYIHRMGPIALDAMGRLIPFFKGMFAELSDYFSHLPLPA